MDAEVNDLASLGVIKDLPAYLLAPEAWTTADNIRFQDGSAQKLLGHTQVFGDILAGNDSFTKVLLHMDGADASTTFTDSNSGGAAHTWTANGNAQIDTAQSVFGGASGLFDGTGDFVSTPDHADFTLGSGDFTIDLRVRPAVDGSLIRACGQVDAAGIANANSAWYIARTAANKLEFGVVQGTTVTTVTSSTNIVAGAFYHVEAVRIGNILRLFINGVQEGGDISFSGSVNDSSAVLAVGRAGALASNEWNGWLDEFRLSVGVARHTAAFTPPTKAYNTTAEVEPHFAQPVRTPVTTMWPWTSLTRAYNFDGTTHADITRAAGPYTAANTRDWNGTVFGGIAIFNNGADVPQSWLTPSSGTLLTNLANFPATERVKVIRSLGSYLVGLYVIDNGAHFPHTIHWSHKASPGTVPSSWDQTDPAVDAGRAELPDVNSGSIVDGLPLRGELIIYKEAATWKMRFIGGRFVFGFSSLFESSGILAPRCVAITGDGTRHVVATQDDIVAHNGSVPTSILSNRWRTTLFSRLDPIGYVNSFMMSNPVKNEMWFCYPENGNSQPTRALIWNYKEGGISEAPIAFRNWAIGNVTGVDPISFDADAGTYDSLGPLDVYDNVQRRKVVILDPVNRKFYLLDDGATRDGVAFAGLLQRTGISLIGRKRTGEPIVDIKARKLIRRLWVKARGGPIDVRIGFQEVPNGAVTWQAPVSFDPATQRFIDATIGGVLPAVEFSSTNSFIVDGYKVELELLGSF